IIGGVKVKDKINVIDNLLEKVDYLMIGGGLAFTFIKAQGHEIGASLLEEDKLDLAKQFLKKAENNGVTLVMPRSEEHTSELQSRFDLVCRLLLEKKKTNTNRSA